MDYIGIIIFIVYVISSIVGGINKNKKKKAFPPRPDDSGSPANTSVPQTFEELIKQAQEKARKIQEEKEFGSQPSETRQPVPANKVPGMEKLPDRRVLQDEETYRPTVAKRPGVPGKKSTGGNLPNQRVLQDEETYRPTVAKRPAAKNQPRTFENPSVPAQARPQTAAKKRYQTPVKKPRAKITGTLDMQNRIQAPENDFFADNAIGDISELEAGKKRKRKSSSIKKKLTEGDEFEFNLRDAVIYSEIMKRKF